MQFNLVCQRNKVHHLEEIRLPTEFKPKENIRHMTIYVLSDIFIAMGVFIICPQIAFPGIVFKL